MEYATVLSTRSRFIARIQVKSLPSEFGYCSIEGGCGYSVVIGVQRRNFGSVATGRGGNSLEMPRRNPFRLYALFGLQIEPGESGVIYGRGLDQVAHPLKEAISMRRDPDGKT